MIDNIYVEAGKIQGVKRKPTLKLLYGKGCETRIRESGITYTLDLQKVMFSPGNINTRSKIKYTDFTGLVVLDMFCGIGYFSLQVLKNSRPMNMIMCDINPDSLILVSQPFPYNNLRVGFLLTPWIFPVSTYILSIIISPAYTRAIFVLILSLNINEFPSLIYDNFSFLIPIRARFFLIFAGASILGLKSWVAYPATVLTRGIYT